MTLVIDWVGHKDFRMVNEVYTHLPDTFRKSEATKLTFGSETTNPRLTSLERVSLNRRVDRLSKSGAPTALLSERLPVFAISHTNDSHGNTACSCKGQSILSLCLPTQALRFSMTVDKEQ